MAIMDPPKTNGKNIVLKSINLISMITFWWVQSLIWTGYKRPLEHADLYNIPAFCETSLVGKKLQRYWQKQLAKKKPSFRWALARAFGFYYMMVGFLVLTEDACRIAQPVLFRYLIQYFSENTTMSTRDAYLYAGGIGICALGHALVGPQIVIRFVMAGMQWQAGTASIVYNKVLRISHKAFLQTKTGHIIDLIANDAEKLDWNLWFLHGIWQGPLQAVVVMTLVYFELGWTVFAGFGLGLLVVPLQAFFGKMISFYREKNYIEMDERVGIMGEIIGAMRLVKMYCWEKPLGAIIRKIRSRELQYVWRVRIFSSLLTELFNFSSRLLPAAIIVVYVFTQNELTPAKVFPMLALFNILSGALLNQLPWGIKTWLEVGVSTDRIEKFLLLEEKQENEHLIYKSPLSPDEDPSVLAANLCASWNSDEEHVTLQDLSFTARKGELLAIVGQVGCGKSSLLQSLLGELPIQSGRVLVCGQVTYSAQQSWVFSSSIRQNVTFGRPYEPDRYKQVLESVAFTKDLEIFPNGDLTLVGEKGVTLSGGQKARINLARALYTDADVYLLDDPLSAVDTHVGKHIFDKCISGLLKDKITILVTHQLQYLKGASKILVLNQGRVASYGSYNELSKSGVDFVRLLSKDNGEEDQDELDETDVEDSDDGEAQLDEEAAQLQKQLSSTKVADELAEEDREVGGVGMSTYTRYFRAGGNYCVLLFMLMLCLITQASYNIGDFWLSMWSSASSLNSSSSSHAGFQFDIDTILHDTYLSAEIYLSITGVMLILGLSRSFVFFRVVMRASATLHKKMYNSVIRAPIRFFDINPKGRVLNRFSCDMNSVDNAVPEIMMEFMQNFLMATGNVVMIVIMNPYVLVAMLPLLVGLLVVRHLYLRTQTEVQRLIAAAHSPTLTHLNASLEGLHTIRAFKAERQCMDDFDRHYNLFTGSWFSELMVFGWFQSRTNVLAALFSGAVSITCVLLAHTLNAGQVGLVLSYVMAMVRLVESTSRQSSVVELEMVKTERVLRYTDLPAEAALENDNGPPAYWPSEGSIVFDQVSFAYDIDEPLVLKNVDCTIQAGEKIGIVGRTGAGKSSLIQALFRMAEPLGQIRVDGIPINDMGLHDIRSKISIIPQDPILFSGTVRTNLDPFDQHDDSELWWALEEVQLKTVVTKLTAGLDSKVTEAGGNFSLGQKQLFCLARALLRNNKILLLDEATANVDKRTDELVQSTIKAKFYDCTVLTIAHRLNTIMDSDRLMVMDGGQVKEFDAPFKLLENRDGVFFQLVEQTGPSEQRRLTDCANDAYHKRFSIQS